jgi:hypothetical protein
MLIDELKTETQHLRAAGRPAFRVGVYVGIALAITLTAWILVANRVPALEAFDRERNMVASALLGLFVLVPVIRYMSAPRSLLMSGLVAWTMLSFVYRLLCLYFSALPTIRTPAQVLMIGFLFYLIAATVAWLGAVIWRVRKSHPRPTRSPLS